MIGYALRRLGYGAVVMVLVTVFTFVVMRLVPGDAVSLQLQETGASAEEVAALRADFGIDQSVWVQLGQWLAGAVRGDLGTSFYGGEPVVDLFMARVPVTVGLGLLAMLVGVLIGIGLGVVAAVTRGSATDSAVRIFAVAFLSVPNFVVALLLLTALAIWFAWSPPIVYAGPGEDLAAGCNSSPSRCSPSGRAGWPPWRA